MDNYGQNLVNVVKDGPPTVIYWVQTCAGNASVAWSLIGTNRQLWFDNNKNVSLYRLFFFSLNFWLQTPTFYSLLLYKLKFIEKRNFKVFATIQHVEIQNKSVGRLEEFKLPRYFCKQTNSLGPAFVYTAADFTSIQNSTRYLA